MPSNPLPNREEFRVNVDVSAWFTDAQQAEAMAKAIREKVLEMFDEWSFMDGYCRNAGVSSRVASMKNPPDSETIHVRLPPKTVADAIREYQELKQTSPVTLLHKVLDKLIGLKCPNCHTEISVVIE
jgi:hypothetical protein